MECCKKLLCDGVCLVNFLSQKVGICFWPLPVPAGSLTVLLLFSPYHFIGV